MVKTPPFREVLGLGGGCAAPSNPFRDAGSRSGGLSGLRLHVLKNLINVKLLIDNQLSNFRENKMINSKNIQKSLCISFFAFLGQSFLLQSAYAYDPNGPVSQPQRTTVGNFHSCTIPGSPQDSFCASCQRPTVYEKNSTGYKFGEASCKRTNGSYGPVNRATCKINQRIHNWNGTLVCG